jgi:hypothetical protein
MDERCLFVLEMISDVGIDHTKLNREQLDAIALPIEAPENFHHDGEISPQQAYYLHSQRLIQCGIVGETYSKAMKLAE